jgi:endonuclease/exonuclease/phosphatase family metal-dependent hydrolase
LQEVENIDVLERLRTDYLEDLGYLPGILVEGTDTRGIDVAFLSRLPIAAEPELHPLLLPEFPDRQGDTRGVLQADFTLPDGSILTGFSVHFPAPFHPTEMRIAAFEHLQGLRAALPDDHHVFAAGDFNTTSSEDARENLLDRYARPDWTLAHDIGCGECNGTHYYGRNDTWSFLDMILFSPARGENATAQIRADSVAIANTNPAQTSPEGKPERFRSADKTGVSDHWPIVATIELAQKQ